MAEELAPCSHWWDWRSPPDAFSNHSGVGPPPMVPLDERIKAMRVEKRKMELSDELLPATELRRRNTIRRKGKFMAKSHRTKIHEDLTRSAGSRVTVQISQVNSPTMSHSPTNRRRHSLYNAHEPIRRSAERSNSYESAAESGVDSALLIQNEGSARVLVSRTDSDVGLGALEEDYWKSREKARAKREQLSHIVREHFSKQDEDNEKRRNAKPGRLLRPRSHTEISRLGDKGMIRMFPELDEDESVEYQAHPGKIALITHEQRNVVQPVEGQLEPGSKTTERSDEGTAALSRVDIPLKHLRDLGSAEQSVQPASPIDRSRPASVEIRRNARSLLKKRVSNASCATLVAHASLSCSNPSPRERQPLAGLPPPTTFPPESPRNSGKVAPSHREEPPKKSSSRGLKSSQSLEDHVMAQILAEHCLKQSLEEYTAADDPAEKEAARQEIIALRRKKTESSRENLLKAWAAERRTSDQAVMTYPTDPVSITEGHDEAPHKIEGHENSSNSMGVSAADHHHALGADMTKNIGPPPAPQVLARMIIRGSHLMDGGRSATIGSGSMSPSEFIGHSQSVAGAMVALLQKLMDDLEEDEELARREKWKAARSVLNDLSRIVDEK